MKRGVRYNLSKHMILLGFSKQKWRETRKEISAPFAVSPHHKQMSIIIIIIIRQFSSLHLEPNKNYASENAHLSFSTMGLFTRII